MKLKEQTRQLQQALAQYTRDGESTSIEGVRQDRLHHYRRLTFNIQLQTMEQAFPIAYSAFESEEWKSIVHDFFLHHDAQTPQIWKLPLEFYEFVRDHDYATKTGKPYLNDLLLFEWIEIEVHTMPDEPIPAFKTTGDVLHDVLVLNPEFRLNKLEYPVHKVKPTEITEGHKGNYFLLTYREKETGAVHFMDLSVLHTFIVEKIVAERESLSHIINEAITIFAVDNTDFIRTSSLDFIHSLKEKKIILGF